jgi:hypothetical protein
MTSPLVLACLHLDAPCIFIFRGQKTKKTLNPHYAIDNPCLFGRQVFRPKTTVNQLPCLNYVLNHSNAMLFVHNSLILCSIESHYDSYCIIRVQLSFQRHLQRDTRHSRAPGVKCALSSVVCYVTCTEQVT